MGSPDGRIHGTTRTVRRFYRISSWANRRGLHRLSTLLTALSRVVVGVEIEPGARIGPGLRVEHGMGVVVGAGCVIGRDCVLHQSVTLGADAGGHYPTVGDGVVIYPGAKLFGAIVVGDGAVIGANAVVNRDVPAGTTVVGVPAHVVGDGDR